MYCRDRQFVLGPQETRDAFAIAELGYVLDRKLFQYSLKAIYCKRKEHFDRFDEMFDRFWSRYYEEKLEKRKKKLQQIKKEPDTATVIFLGAKFNVPKKENKIEAKQTKGANESIRLRMTDFSKVNVTDKERLEELAEELFHQMSMRFKGGLKIQTEVELIFAELCDMDWIKVDGCWIWRTKKNVKKNAKLFLY